MKIIVHAEPEDIPAVVAMMLEARKQFARHEERIGWGWVFAAAGKSWFVRQIEGGLSARESKP